MFLLKVYCNLISIPLIIPYARFFVMLIFMSYPKRMCEMSE